MNAYSPIKLIYPSLPRPARRSPACPPVPRASAGPAPNTYFYALERQPVSHKVQNASLRDLAPTPITSKTQHTHLR